MTVPTVFRATRYRIAHMDCAAEEQMVRMALARHPTAKSLAFDLDRRELAVVHRGTGEDIARTLSGLGLGCEVLESVETSAPSGASGDGKDQSLLKAVLAINGLFFILELSAGIFGRSMGLMADSLDMFADAVVYGMALSVAAMGFAAQRKVALSAGFFQMILAVSGLVEVLRRFAGTTEIPDASVMMAVSALALGANAVSLWLLGRSTDKGLHLQASRMFTSTDIWANAGVIAAGFLVAAFHSKWPDLAVGLVVFVLVGRGALRIFRLAKGPPGKGFPAG